MNTSVAESTTNLPVLTLLVLVVAAILTLPTSTLFLRLYRRRVIAAMAARRDGRRTAASVSDAARTLAPPALSISLTEDRPTDVEGADAAALSRLCMERPWRSAGVYAVAGTTFALVLTAAEMQAADVAFGTIRFLVLLSIFAWPLVPAIALVAASSRRSKLLIVVAYFGWLGLLCAVAAARSPDVAAWQLALPWLAINLVPTLVLPLIFVRRVRAVGPLVLAFFAVAFVGATYAQETLANEVSVQRAAVAVGTRLGLGAWGVILSVIAIGLAIFGVAALGVWAVLRRAYERKRASDQSMTVDAIWVVFALSGGAFITNNGAIWLLSAPAAFVVYLAVRAIGFHLLRRRDQRGPRAKPERLLLLRVFSLGRRSEHLYHVVETHWRHAGSIQLITGPDLATTTVEPHEFLDFLRGRLARRFIDTPSALETRLGEMDLQPDLDGRYRVNDFFCHDDSWRLVLRRLVAETDLALIDLRGFSQIHAGAAFEIKALVDAVPLERIVILVDDGTDEAYLGRVVGEGWGEISIDSPNRAAASPRLRLLRLRGRLGAREIDHLIGALAQAATARHVGWAELDRRAKDAG